jgi:anaerobic dimethyl sulfoxide reductase subunit A
MQPEANDNNNEQIVTTTCSLDCGGRCLLKIHLGDKKITRITTENRHGLHLKACPKGLAQNHVVHHPDRLMQPMKRVGERGTGQFEPISWDEALQIIAGRIRTIKSQSSTQSICFVTNTGSMATLHNTPAVTRRFFGMVGRCTTTWGDPSYEGALQSSLATFGTSATGSTRDNLLSSKLIILWGWNPLVSRFGPDTMPYLSQAKKNGVKIVCVDPRQSDTCRGLNAQWVPVKPGTDTALLAAMAHVIISEELLDRDDIERVTHGFDSFYDYIMGTADNIPKTPQWAHAICHTPMDSIIALARDYATSKPASLIAGWAPGRSAHGEQFHRAVSTLAAISGNIGIDGGHAAGGPDYVDMGVIDTLPVPETNHHEIHFTGLYDYLLNKKPEPAHPDCKLLYIVGCNLLNQNLNINKGRKALMRPEFIVTHELFLTPTARFADIILPVKHFFEQEDIGQPFVGGPYCIHMSKVLDASCEVKSDLDIFSEISSRIGIENYNDKSEAAWLETFLDSDSGFPDLETFKGEAVQRLEARLPHVAFKKEITDPKNHPFPTPSGKIEIFSSRFAEMDNPAIPPIPTYIESWEGPQDPLAKKFPIQLISPHSRSRANSQFDNVEAMKKYADDHLWMNSGDADRRGVTDGDAVYVHNHRGRIRTWVKVTDRIIPGCASMDQGQWYAPDDQGIDSGGSINVLTNDKMSPAGAFPCNTCLVQIEKCSD